jgi:hypothetical protein
VAKRLALAVLALAACHLGAYLGAWWVPFPVGVAAGLPAVASRIGRGGVPGAPVFAAVGAALGWALPLWTMALSRLPVGATARAIAALAGLPAYAAVTVAVTLLLAVLQALAGAWLARAAFPRQAVTPALVPGPAGAPEPGVTPEDLGHPQT